MANVGKSKTKRRKADSPPAEQLDVADGEDADSDRDSVDDCETDSAPEDEFAQLPESQAATDSRAAEEEEEDATPWDTDARAETPGEGVTVCRTGARHRNSNGRTNGNRENRGPNREEQRSGPAAGIAPDSQRQVDPGEHQRAENEQSDGNKRQLRAGGANQDTQRSQEQSPPTGVENETSDGRTKAEKRKAMTAIRNRRRDRKIIRAEEISLVGHDQYQRDLQVIVGAGISPQEHRSMVPWEHRGILGLTRGGGGQDAAAAAGGGQDGAWRR